MQRAPFAIPDCPRFAVSTQAYRHLPRFVLRFREGQRTTVEVTEEAVVSQTRKRDGERAHPGCFWDRAHGCRSEHRLGAPTLSPMTGGVLWTGSKLSFRHPGVFIRKKLERAIGLQIGDGSHLARSFECIRGC